MYYSSRSFISVHKLNKIFVISLCILPDTSKNLVILHIISNIKPRLNVPHAQFSGVLWQVFFKNYFQKLFFILFFTTQPENLVKQCFKFTLIDSFLVNKKCCALIKNLSVIIKNLSCLLIAFINYLLDFVINS